MIGMNRIIMKKKYLLPLAFILLFKRINAQEMLGHTGGFNIPTAEMNPSGTFRIGINYMEKGMNVPELNTNDHRWLFNYDTFNYFVNFTFFNWFEATFRETILESNSYGQKEDYKLFREQDRSITIKIRPLTEGKYHPAIALGCTDPYSFTGHHIYASAWGAMTKNIHSKVLHSTFTTTIGYSKAFDDSEMYDGIFAGLKWTPDFWSQGHLMVEYDTKGINIGIMTTLWKHIGIYCFTREFEMINAGFKYETTIKF